VTLGESELSELRQARQLLERGSLAVRLAELLGGPVEKGLALLPDEARQRVQALAERALSKALGTALTTLSPQARRPASERLHRVATMTTGALGGLFGLGGLALELPVTTVLLFRSIAEIARSEGHDLAAPETRLACLEVFALGGSSRRDDADTAYYVVRTGLARAGACAGDDRLALRARGRGEAGALRAAHHRRGQRVLDQRGVHPPLPGTRPRPLRREAARDPSRYGDRAPRLRESGPFGSMPLTRSKCSA
jgi:EcsC family protein